MQFLSICSKVQQNIYHKVSIIYMYIQNHTGMIKSNFLTFRYATCAVPMADCQQNQIIERTAMISNRYNYLTPSIQDTKGKRDALKVTASQSKHYKQKTKRTVSFPKELAKRLSKIKISPGHTLIHAKTYNYRNSKPQQKHHLGTVSKNLTGELKPILHGHNPRP